MEGGVDGIFAVIYANTCHPSTPDPPASFTVFSHFRAQWTQCLDHCTKETVVTHFKSEQLYVLLPGSSNFSF